MQRQMGLRAAATVLCLAASAAWASSDAPLRNSEVRPVSALALQQDEYGGTTQQEEPTTTEPTTTETTETTETKVTYEEPAEHRGASYWGLIGAGADRYVGDLTGSLGTVPAAAVTIGGGMKYIGLEGMYNLAALNEDSGKGSQGLRNGTDIVRNTVQAALQVGLLDRKFTPFVMSGGGIDFYNVRLEQAQQDATGWHDDTAFYVPVGGGLRYKPVGAFTVDLRYTYNFLFGEGFAPVNASTNRHEGLLTVGGAF